VFWLFVRNRKDVIKLAMSSSADREKMLSEMTRAEKAELLQWIVRDLGDDFPGIESKPDVMGGVPCIPRTRIPVWLLEQARRLGTSEADLLRDYPTLNVQDLANAWNFVRSHRSEIEEQIAANERDDD
jgi:uncharacterized protein (DUF433 family)